jgi:MraZ protein
LSKQLLEHAGITKDAVFSAQGNKVEIWDTKSYHAAMEMSADDYSNLANEVLGSNFLNPNDGE